MLPEPNDDEQRLTDAVADALATRSVPDAVRRRIERELRLLAPHAPVILRAFDTATVLREHGYPFDVAGASWASSAVNWVLGITEENPVEAGFHFERFFNPARAARPPPPSFSVPAAAMPVITRWLVDRFGPTRIVELGLTTRGAATTRLCGLGVAPPAPNWAGPGVDRRQDFGSLRRVDRKQASTLGLEVLGLSSARALNVLERVFAVRGEPTEPADFARLVDAVRSRRIPLQLPAFQQLLAALEPSCFEHAVAAQTLFRPSAEMSGLSARYVRRRHHEEVPAPPHPLVEGLTADTYGLLLYDEQVVDAVVAVTGASHEWADLVRRDLAREGVRAAARIEADFIAAAWSTGLSAGTARDALFAVATAAPWTASRAEATVLARRLCTLVTTATRFAHEWQAACATEGLDA